MNKTWKSRGEVDPALDRRKIRLPERRDQPKPSFYTVAVGKGAVVIVQAGLVADLAQHPQSQLNLIHFARLALHPQPACLPQLTSQCPQP